MTYYFYVLSLVVIIVLTYYCIRLREQTISLRKLLDEAKSKLLTPIFPERRIIEFTKYNAVHQVTSFTHKSESSEDIEKQLIRKLSEKIAKDIMSSTKNYTLSISHAPDGSKQYHFKTNLAFYKE